MGQVCSRSCATYAPLGMEEDDWLKSRKEQRLQSFELMFGDSLRQAARSLWWAGVLRWGSLPFTVLLGVMCSSCQEGLPPALYLVPGSVALAGWAQERCAIRSLWGFTDMAEHVLDLSDAAEDADVRRYLAAFRASFELCSPPCCTWRPWTLLNHWVCLQVFGLIAALDLITDALMTGQVKRCEDGLHGNFKHEFAAAWVVPGFTVLEHVGLVLDQIGLAGLCFTMLLMVSIVQGWYGLRHVNQLEQHANAVMANSVSRYTEPDCCSLGGGGLDFTRRMVSIAEVGAIAGEWAAAMYVQTFFSCLAGEFARVGKETRGRLYAAQLRIEETARETERFHIHVASVVRRVLLHAVPFMYLTLVFMSLVFNHVFDSQGRAKIALSFALSGYSALSQASATFKMTRCSTCYLLIVPPLTACAIMALVAAMAVDFAMGFTCDHFVFSLLHWKCMDGRELDTDAARNASLLSGLNRGVDTLAPNLRDSLSDAPGDWNLLQ